jgi:hypothetical protein
MWIVEAVDFSIEGCLLTFISHRYDTVFRCRNCSGVPEGGGHSGGPLEAERPASGQAPAEQFEGREDAESQVSFEPRDSKEKHPRGNVERRETPVCLARRSVQESY